MSDWDGTERRGDASEDRVLLRAIHDALIGTLTTRGLITRIDIIEGRIDTHITESANEARRIAERAAQVAEAAAVAATRPDSVRRVAWDIVKYASASVLALLATWLGATFWLGLKLSVK